MAELFKKGRLTRWIYMTRTRLTSGSPTVPFLGIRIRVSRIFPDLAGSQSVETESVDVSSALARDYLTRARLGAGYLVEARAKGAQYVRGKGVYRTIPRSV